MFCTIWYCLYNLKKCEKHRWRNVTFSKFAGLHYSWKCIRRNVNSFYCNYILILSRIDRSHQSRTLTFQKNFVISFIQSSLKMTKYAFYFILKTLFVLMIFKFLPSLDWKDKVNFKIYDVTTWLTNNYNAHIAQYLTKWRQSDNDTWSINRIYQEKYYASKIM